MYIKNKHFKNINKEIDVILTEYGSFISNNTEYSFSEFERLYREDNSRILDFTYDEVNMCFVIDVLCYDRDRRFTIHLAEEYKNNLRKGIINKDIQTLMDHVQEVQLAKKERRIISKIQKTGDLPSDSQEIIIYNNYLNRKKRYYETQAYIDYVKVTSPIVIGLVTGLFYQNLANINLPEPLKIGAVLAGGFMTFRNAILVYEDSLVESLINNINDLKNLQYKLIKLKLKCEQLGLLKEGQSIKELSAAEEDDFNYEVPSSIKM